MENKEEKTSEQEKETKESAKETEKPSEEAEEKEKLADKEKKKTEEFPEFETNIDVFNPSTPIPSQAEPEKQTEQPTPTTHKTEDKKQTKQPTPTTPKKKTKAKEQVEKKDRAIVYGTSLPISTKHSTAICKFIIRKQPQKAIEELEQVIKLKKAIPMKGELPHRKGMMSGRYPVNASKIFIKLLKQLIGNSNVNQLEEPIIIQIAKADRASRPYRRGGNRKFKRTNILLEAREKLKIRKKGEKKK